MAVCTRDPGHAAAQTPRLPSRPTHRHPVQLDGRNSHAHRHALPILAAGPDPLVQLQVVAHHRHVLQRLRPVADQRGVAHRRGDLAVLDQVRL